MVKVIFVETQRFSCKLIFDDGSSLCLRKKDVDMFKIVSGMRIEKDLLCQQLVQAQIAEGYDAALSMLERSARTEMEIRSKLLLKGYLAETVDCICERLKKSRLIDDQAIAERITSAMSQSGKGRYAVLQKLRARGIDTLESEKALETLHEQTQQQNALSQAKKLLPKYDSFDEWSKKKKLSQALARRGFSWESIEYAIERLEDE